MERLCFEAAIKRWLLIGLPFLLCGQASAVCPGPAHVCSEFFHSDAVFVGTVVSIQVLPPNEKEDFVGGWAYRLKVARSYRGTANDTIEVTTEDASARYPLELGHKYVLFASEWRHHLWIYSCGNSSEFSAAGQTIKELEDIVIAMKTDRGGDIWGKIGLYDSRDFEGVRVVAYGHSKKYVGVADDEGRFHIRVPAGKYSVRVDPSSIQAISPRGIVFTYSESYDDPKHVVVQNGGCADLWFIVGEKQ